MTDIVHYRIPLGWLGDFANTLFVRRQLEGLFSYRTSAVENSWKTRADNTGIFWGN